jgi:hypothetical protein
MTSQTPDIQTILERLEKLERHNRRLKRAGALALVVVSAVLLMGQAAPKSRIVEAEEFVVKDSSGKMRAVFGVAGKDAPRLLLFESGGGFSKLGPTGFSLFDAKVFPLAKLETGDDGPSLFLSQVSGESVGLAVFKGSPGLKVKTGKGGAFLTVAPYGPDLWLTDEKDKERFGVSIDSNGPHLSLSDIEGFETSIGITDLVTPHTGESHKTSAASLVMFDKEKKVLWRAP